MTRNESAPEQAVPGANELNGGGEAAVCVYSSESRWDDATLKAFLVEALENIQAESFALAAAVSMDVLDDWPGFREA